MFFLLGGGGGGGGVGLGLGFLPVILWEERVRVTGFRANSLGELKVNLWEPLGAYAVNPKA